MRTIYKSEWSKYIYEYFKSTDPEEAAVPDGASGEVIGIGEDIGGRLKMGRGAALRQLYRVATWVLCCVASVGFNGALGAEPAGSIAAEQSKAGDTPGANNAKATPTKPNVVWIVLDALRAENLSCYGYHRKTSPRMEALAAEGTLFEWAYSQANYTRHSVPSFLTGRYFPVQVLSFGTWRELWRTPPSDEQFLPEIAARNGYRTLLFSATPWIYQGSRLWGMFHEPRYVTGAGSTEEANKQFLPWLEKRPAGPFFAYIHVMETHFPHAVEELRPNHTQWIDEANPRLPAMASQVDTQSGKFTETDRELLTGLYDGSIHYEDEHIGRLVDRFKELGLYDNTVFIISADHGEALAENGSYVGHLTGWTYEQLLRVPLILAGPGIPKGLRVKQKVELVDLVPTLKDLCGFNTDVQPHGKSLTGIFKGNSDILHEYVFAKYGYPSQDGVVSMVLQSDTYKYEWDPATGAEHLWALPDRLESRVDKIAHNPQIAAQYKKILETQYLPLWQAYDKTPHTTPAVFVEKLSPARCTTPEAYVKESPEKANWTDGKWTLTSEYLASCPWSEKTSPITFKFEVPNGRFRVELYAGHSANHPPDGHRASSFIFSAQGGPKTVFTLKTQPPRNVNWHTYVSLGEHTITNQEFTLTLAQGDKEFWAIARRLQFTPLSATSASEKNPQSNKGEVDEQLRALGYIK